MPISRLQPGCPCDCGVCCPDSFQTLYLTTPLHTVTLTRQTTGPWPFYGEATIAVNGYDEAHTGGYFPQVPLPYSRCGDLVDALTWLYTVPVTGLIKYGFNCSRVEVYVSACVLDGFGGGGNRAWQWLDIAYRSLGWDVNTGNAVGSFNCGTLSGQYAYVYSGARSFPTTIGEDGRLLLQYAGSTFTVSA